MEKPPFTNSEKKEKIVQERAILKKKKMEIKKISILNKTES